MRVSCESRLTVYVHRGAMREVEDFVTTFAAAQRLAADDRARTLIVIEELLTNLSKYGYPGQSEPRGVAEVMLELQSNQLTIEFADDGNAFDPLASAASSLDQPPEERPVGGLGLHIVRQFADEARYERRDGRNVIRIRRRVSLLKRPDPEL